MSESIITIILAAVISFLLGSFPSGYVYAKIAGIDIRQHGSGNIGMTNIWRVLGVTPGIIVLFLDALKGFIAVYWLVNLTPHPNSDIIRVVCGMSAVLGHTFSIFLKFKGGKGVATTFGVFLGLAPIATMVVLLALLAVLLATRYMSLASLISAVLFPCLIWLVGEAGQYFSIFILSVIIGSVIFIRHIDNIKRLLAGTESKIGRKAKVESGEKV